MGATRNPFEPKGTRVVHRSAVPADFELSNVSITPPSSSIGDAIDTTTLANSTHKTKMAPNLIESGELSFTAEYDPELVANAPYGVWGTIYIYIPDQGLGTFKGHLENIEPNELTVGERAMCSGKYVITNTDEDRTTEVPPVWDDSATDIPA